MKKYVLILFAFLVTLPSFSQDNMEIWNPYLAKIEKDVKTSWYKTVSFNRHNKECRTTLLFTIKKDGALGTITVLSSDCDKQMQDNAILAVRKITPFAPFPKGITGIDEININYNLDYKVLPENKRISQNAQSNLPQSLTSKKDEKQLEKKVENQTINKEDKKQFVSKKVIFISLSAILVLAGSILLLVLYKRRKY